MPLFIQRETLENLSFPDVFRGDEKTTLARNSLVSLTIPLTLALFHNLTKLLNTLQLFQKHIKLFQSCKEKVIFYDGEERSVCQNLRSYTLVRTTKYESIKPLFSID